MTAILTEAQAAELEGIGTPTDEQLARIRRKRQIDATIARLTAEKQEIRDTTLAELKAEGLNTLTYKGKNVVHVTEVTTSKIDTTRLKAELPDVANRYVKTTTTTRVDIS